MKHPCTAKTKESLPCLGDIGLKDSLADRLLCHCIPRHLADFFLDDLPPVLELVQLGSVRLE